MLFCFYWGEGEKVSVIYTPDRPLNLEGKQECIGYLYVFLNAVTLRHLDFTISNC